MKQKALTSIFLAAAALALAPLPSRAEGLCDGADVASKLPKPPDGCQSERISASGNQRPSHYWATKSAEDHWSDQVLNKYGERFERWSNAACARTECGPAAIAGFTRCTYTGYPCAHKPYVDSGLSEDEVSEMQRLLSKKGFTTKVDGVFGEKTHEALSAWQRSMHLPDDGVPSPEVLAALRKA